MVDFGEKWLYSDKRCCIRAKFVVFGQSGFTPEGALLLGQCDLVRTKVVVFGQDLFYP